MRIRSSSLPLLGILLLACLVLAACGGHGSQLPTEPQAATDKSMAASASPGDAGRSNHGHGDDGGSSSLDLDLHPDTWNTEWSHSEGTVAAFVRGNGIADIDLSTLKLSGPAGSPLSPVSSRRNRHQVVARFAKEDAIKLVGTAKPGDKVTITLSFMAKGASQKLSETVRVVGPEGDDD